MAQERPSKSADKRSTPPGGETSRPVKDVSGPFRERASGEGSRSAMERMKLLEKRKAFSQPQDERPLFGLKD